jgi:hypothetical protein
MMDVIDTKTNEIAWSLLMSPAPSPMAVTKKPDGSTDKIYGQLGGPNAFAVVDFATQKKIDEVKLPELPADKQNRSGPPAPSHGIAITADQKTLLVNSRLNSALYAQQRLRHRHQVAEGGRAHPGRLRAGAQYAVDAAVVEGKSYNAGRRATARRPFVFVAQLCI